MRINRVYTRTGDAGQTGLVGGERVPKESPRIEAYGTLDELNSFLGGARGALERAANAQSGEVRDDLLWGAALLKEAQQRVFDAGNQFATTDAHFLEGMPAVTAEHIAALEEAIDRLSGTLEPLQSFVLPGGGEAVASLHVARTVCRRAERDAWRLHRTDPVPPEALRYLNRLSDCLFVLARWVGKTLGEPETLWEK